MHPSRLLSCIFPILLFYYNKLWYNNYMNHMQRLLAIGLRIMGSSFMTGAPHPLECQKRITAMKSEISGQGTLDVEVTNISSNGVWLYLKDREYFLSYEQYPWFKDARVSQIMSVVLQHSRHLYWPELDIDLSVDILEHPDRYHLTAK
ncbi:hypothetical protein MBAV_002144 [Candidatus Magnetobacterium bavaricum]|uniref:DUF2442 domain-containing protein n=1 Tax=Candidatus Magnetobacterium bavaricum TaxID=29290 RepID=A0A0F3GUW8_9BACT|nr:hypothetical protein MBAV_002144 [Candidatus Magnetobacterium bavaricum]